MNLALERAEFFIHDFELQAGWYVREANLLPAAICRRWTLHSSSCAFSRAWADPGTFAIPS